MSVRLPKGWSGPAAAPFKAADSIPSRNTAPRPGGRGPRSARTGVCTLNNTGTGGPRGLPRGGFRRIVKRAELFAVALAGLLVGRDGASAQWVEEPGRGWIALAAYHSDTRENFGPEGDAGKLPDEGHAVTTSAFATMAVGLAETVDLWSQIAFHRLRYDNAAANRSSSGIGDIRLWLRAAPLKWLGLRVPFAVRAGVKVPVSEFDVAPTEVALGDGQRDWEVMAELGYSLWPLPLYASGWMGYRWREANSAGTDFGNELFYYAQIGGQSGPLGYKLSVDGWNGAAAGAAGGDANPALERDLVQLLPSLLYDVGAGWIEAGMRFALGGRNATGGSSFVLKYFRGWTLF